MIPFSLIVAIDQGRGIGKDGGLPWHLPEDLKYFKQTTTSAPQGYVNAVVMGRKTWESIPEKYRPLPSRINVVLTRRKQYALADGVVKASSLEQAMEILDEGRVSSLHELFVIGGAEIFELAIHHPACRAVYITEIAKNFECDAHFPELPDRFKLQDEGAWLEANGVSFRFLRYCVAQSGARPFPRHQ